MKKDIATQSVTTKKSGSALAFHSKMAQAVEMLCAVAAHFTSPPVVVATDLPPLLPHG